MSLTGTRKEPEMSAKRAFLSLACGFAVCATMAQAEVPASWSGWAKRDRPALGLDLASQRWQLGFEITHADHRMAAMPGSAVRSQGRNLSLVATAPLTPSLSLYGRLDTSTGSAEPGWPPAAREPGLSGSLGLRWKY
jgi:hypothetical protein